MPVGVARDVDHAHLRLAHPQHVPGLHHAPARHARDPISRVSVHPQPPAAQFLQLQVAPRVIVVLMRGQDGHEVYPQLRRQLVHRVRVRRVDRRRLPRGVVYEQVGVVVPEERDRQDRGRGERGWANASRVHVFFFPRVPHRPQVEPSSQTCHVDEVPGVEEVADDEVQHRGWGEGVDRVERRGEDEPGGAQRGCDRLGEHAEPDDEGVLLVLSLEFGLEARRRRGGCAPAAGESARGRPVVGGIGVDVHGGVAVGARDLRQAFGSGEALQRQHVLLGHAVLVAGEHVRVLGLVRGNVGSHVPSWSRVGAASAAQEVGDRRDHVRLERGGVAVSSGAVGADIAAGSRGVGVCRGS